MVTPSTLVSEIVTLLQAIPALVTAMGEDATKIYGHSESYSKLDEAIHDMESPSIMVAYQGWQGGDSLIRHQVSIFNRAANGSSTPDMAAGIIYGTPDGQTLPLVYMQVNSALDGMHVSGFSRQTDAEGVEYWQLDIYLDERWG